MPTPVRRSVRRFVFVAPSLLAATALAALLAARAAPIDPPPGAAAGPLAPLAVRDAGNPWHTSPWGQLVFFAVLEGLYADGVQPDVVRAVLSGPPDDPSVGRGAADPSSLPPQESWQRYLETTLFVPACPLCTPALVAFETYAARGPLHLKDYHADGRPLDTFGPGLPAALVARLTDPRRAVRLAALQELVTTWIERRLDLGRATAAEREELRHWMENGRKVGMNQLGALRASIDAAAAASWPRCATCDASVEACSR